MINIKNVISFFSGVVSGNGFILSSDTCNPSHIGPKIADVLVKLDPDSFYDIMRELGIEYYDYLWGKDSESDGKLVDYLWEQMYHTSNVASVYVKGLEDFSWGYSEHDGALLGWFRYDPEI